MTPLLAGLALGVAGSLHCVAMCGPLVGVMAPVFGRGWAPALWYTSGRIGAYVILGSLAGLAGATVQAAGLGRGLSMAAGLVMVLVALGQFAGPRRRLGGWWTRRLAGVMERLAWLRAGRPRVAAVVAGGVNGALPCGLVYVAVLTAATAGDPVQGMAVMVMFGLGTAPVMLGAWLATASVPVAVRLRLRALMPLAVGLVGLLLIARGLSDAPHRVEAHASPEAATSHHR